MEKRSSKDPLRRRRRPRISPSRLDALIEEAVVDAYTDAEQAGGLHAMIEQELDLPFETTVLGVMVSVKRVDINDNDEIVALCSRGRARQTIPILELPLPDPPPNGWAWIEAYRRWARGRS